MIPAKSGKRFTIVEVSEITGLDRTHIVMFIEREWVSPPERDVLDEEDVARIRLIRELQEDFGANDDAIPLILHLVDQLCHLRNQMWKQGQKEP